MEKQFCGEGGGALINQGQHILDMWQYLFGMPRELYASIPFGKYNNFAVDDEATIIMRYDDGMTGTFILSTGEACCEERLEVIGTKGRALLIDNTLTLTKHQDVTGYIRDAAANSREDMEFTEETIEFEKQPEPYPALLENLRRHRSDMMIHCLQRRELKVLMLLCSVHQHIIRLTTTYQYSYH